MLKGYCYIEKGRKLEELSVFDPYLFRFLKKHTVDGDVKQRVKLLSALTEDGKDILHFEEEVIRLSSLLGRISRGEENILAMGNNIT